MWQGSPIRTPAHPETAGPIHPTQSFDAQSGDAPRLLACKPCQGLNEGRKDADGGRGDEGGCSADIPFYPQEWKDRAWVKEPQLPLITAPL